VPSSLLAQETQAYAALLIRRHHADAARRIRPMVDPSVIRGPVCPGLLCCRHTSSELGPESLRPQPRTAGGSVNAVNTWLTPPFLDL
jgi:hypothetical protein